MTFWELVSAVIVAVTIYDLMAYTIIRLFAAIGNADDAE